jgi:hypothetical protein
MSNVIDAKFKVIKGPNRPDPRWVFYIIRMGLGLVAIGAVIIGFQQSPPPDQTRETERHALQSAAREAPRCLSGECRE